MGLEEIHVHRRFPEHMAHTGLGPGTEQLVVQIQPLCQLHDDLVIRPGLAQGGDHWLGPLAVAAAEHLELAALEAGTAGQHDVRQLGGVRQEQVDVHEEVQLLERLLQLLVGVEHPVVHPVGPHGLDGVWGALPDLPGQVAPLHLPHHLVPQGEALRPHRAGLALGVLLKGELVVQGGEARHGVGVGQRAGDHAAGAVIAAHEGGQGHHRPVGLHPVLVVDQGGPGLVDGQGGVVVDHPGGLPHLVGGDAGELLHPLGGESHDIVPIGLVAVDVLPDVVVVHPVVDDQLPPQAQGQGAVGARPGAQVQVAHLLRRRGDAGVDDDDLHPLLPGPLQPGDHQVGGVIGVAAPPQKHPRPPQVRGGEVRAGGQAPGHDGGGEAGGGLGAVVHRAEGVAQPLQKGPVPLVVAGVEGHR